MNDNFLSLAKKIVSLGGDISSKAFLDQSFESKFKANKTIVTNIDIEIEKKQRDLIRKTFPGHGIHGEEGKDYQVGSDYIWYLDPIDGTSNFTLGIPTFCSMAALAYKGQVIVAAINSPILNKLYWASVGQGTYLNEEKIYISQEKRLKNSKLAIDRVSTTHDKKRMVDFLSSNVDVLAGVKLVNSIGITAGIVAEGKLDAQVCFGQSLHDLVVPYLIIREAGAIVIDESGSEWNLDSKELFIAGNQTLSENILRIID